MKDCGVPSFAEIEMNFDDFQAQALMEITLAGQAGLGRHGIVGLCSAINHRALFAL